MRNAAAAFFGVILIIVIRPSWRYSSTVSSPWAASTEIACSTLARQDAVENGRTMPVVPRIEMPPMMPSLALVVLRAIRSPSGTEMITVAPLVRNAWAIETRVT